jgi:hypothetical protein
MDSKSGKTIQVWPQEKQECHDGKDKAGIFVYWYGDYRRSTSWLELPKNIDALNFTLPYKQTLCVQAAY